MGPHQEPRGSPRSSSPRSNIKEKVQELIHQLLVLPGLTFKHKPGFVNLVEGDPDG